MDTYLVTGGAGFIGANLAIGIKREISDSRVIALDNLKRSGSELNIRRLAAAGVEFVHGDVRNPEDLDCLQDVAFMVDCSAEPSVLASYSGSPAYVLNTNLCGTMNCLELARRCRSGIVFLSTSRIYPVKTINHLSYAELATRYALTDRQSVPGATERGISEEFPLEGARSLYGATKLCSELLLAEYLDMYGLKGVVNRCGVVAGPWQMGKTDQGVLALWVARHLFRGSLQYIGYGGSGKQVRDMLHVDDLVRLIVHEIRNLDALSGQTFNVGGELERAVSLQELTLLCQEATGNRIEIGGVAEERPADIRLYVTDSGRIKAATGWSQTKSVRDIVEDTYHWMQERRDTLQAIFGA